MANDDENEAQNGTAPVGKGAKAARPKTSHPLPTERIARTKQLEMVRAYGQLSANGASVNAAEVATMVGLTTSTMSLANGFLTDVGLLVRTTDGLAPNSDVINFARAYEWNAETAGEKLAPTFESSWIGAALLRKIRFRAHTKQEALALLADASGASASHKGQLEDILEMLVFAALVAIEGDNVRAGKLLQSSGGGQAATPAAQQPEAPAAVVQKPVEPAVPAAAQQAPGVSFNISMSVTMAEIATLTPDKITAFFTGVAAVMKIQSEIDAAKKGSGNPNGG